MYRLLQISAFVVCTATVHLCIYKAISPQADASHVPSDKPTASVRSPQVPQHAGQVFQVKAALLQVPAPSIPLLQVPAPGIPLSPTAHIPPLHTACCLKTQISFLKVSPPRLKQTVWCKSLKVFLQRILVVVQRLF